MAKPEDLKVLRRWIREGNDLTVSRWTANLRMPPPLDRD
jgi:hypothetical protein